MLKPAHVSAFAVLDTTMQVQVLRRTGLDTDAADTVLGHLAGMFPDRYSALMVALERTGVLVK